MSGVAAGRLRHWVEIQSVGQGVDPITGGYTEIWEKFDDVWAEVVMLSGKEFISANAEQSEVGGRVTIRFRQDVDATMRIIYRGQTYQILAVMEDAESMFEHMTLMVSKGVRLPDSRSP